MASAPDLWTMLCTGMALLGAAHWRTRLRAQPAVDVADQPASADEPAAPHRTQDERASRRSA